MLERRWVGLVVLVFVTAGCGGPSTPPGASGSAPPQSSVVVPAPQPAAQCPAGSRFSGVACVYTEVTCPAGSRRMHDACMGDVTCPGGTAWDGDTCRAGATGATTASAATPTATPPPTASPPSSLAAPPPGSCFFNLNSIPASQVELDGVALGWTPRLRAPASPGTHVVAFVAGHEKKTMHASCAAGETKAIMTKFQAEDPGY